ncbi:MAG: nucleotide sugar dehydrogenase [Halothiobacillaceae bacterium]
MTMLPQHPHIGIIGLGYVGLPLAIAFGRILPTLGLEINTTRIAQLRQHCDTSGEASSDELAAAQHLTLTSNKDDLRACNVFIITVPTPVDDARRPDLHPLQQASLAVARVLKKGDVVIFESTVYPGCTEEYCLPILEQQSGLRLHEDFSLGYSPERVNPGDKQRRLADVIKVTSGSSPQAAQFVDALYRQIIHAGTHLASSIRVAEAAKVIENTQRDVNIALINELAILFHRLGLDSSEVLAAAGSKWNFLPFRPGLVGGHCIGVDPYYLTYKAQQIGYHPEMILAGRRINDGMGAHVAQRVIKLLGQRGVQLKGARALILGVTFKEDCPDIRNTRVIDIAHELRDYGLEVLIHDPIAHPDEVQHEYAERIESQLPQGEFAAVIIAVAHKAFKAMPTAAFRALCTPNGVLFDVKSILSKEDVDDRL